MDKFFSKKYGQKVLRHLKATFLYLHIFDTDKVMTVNWTQSYDFDLQRRRCKFLQRHG
jgi:hypothetical protein